MQIKTSMRHFHITIRKIKKNADDVECSQECGTRDTMP